MSADGYDTGKAVKFGGEGQKEKKKKKKTVIASQKCSSSPLILKSVACKC